MKFFTKNEYTNKDKELNLYERERKLEIKEGLQAEQANASEAVIVHRKRALSDLADSECDYHTTKGKREVELVKLSSDLELKKKENELEAEKHHSTLLDANKELEKENVLASAQLATTEEKLEYTKKHIQSINAEKDGIIKGQELAIQMYKDQMDYMQKVLAVAVGKIPTVDFSTVRFNIEQPAPVKGGQDNKPKENQPK